ncbi:hypothetical protein [Thermogemmatispora sp.]|uniref:hypothetical protein n=1 Tax=Thermogemmatispora sp. TaxID=1968838 RepID=UPI0035E446DC
MLLSWHHPEWTNELLAEEFLPQCSASLAACWHLLKGNGLATVREILPRFAPTLMLMARQTTRYQRVAARLATQAAILQAILAMHRMDIAGRERYCLEAIRCSRAAADERLECAALMYLGYTYSFCYRPRQPRKAIAVFEEALRVLGTHSWLLRSDVAMGLAEAYAQCGDERQALHFMTVAQDAFPTRPELDPSFAYAECGLECALPVGGKDVPRAERSLLQLWLSTARLAGYGAEPRHPLGLRTRQQRVNDLSGRRRPPDRRAGSLRPLCTPGG